MICEKVIVPPVRRRHTMHRQGFEPSARSRDFRLARAGADRSAGESGWRMSTYALPQSWRAAVGGIALNIARSGLSRVRQQEPLCRRSFWLPP